MRLSVLAVFWVTFIVDLSDGGSVTKQEPLLTQTEGEDATLTCTYTDDGYYLFWYRQYPGRQPEFAVQMDKDGGSEFKADFAQNRFSDTVQQTDKSHRLTISELRLYDTAVYYCAQSLTVMETSDNLVQ